MVPRGLTVTSSDYFILDMRQMQDTITSQKKEDCNPYAGDYVAHLIYTCGDS